MSDTMLIGVLRMPHELAMGDELSRYQYWQRGQQAAQEIEALREQIAAAQACNVKLLAAVQANHEWHETYDEYGGYPESDICEQNTRVIGMHIDTTALTQALTKARKEMRRAAVAVVDAECLGFADDDAQLRRIIAAIEALPAEPTAADQADDKKGGAA